MGDLDVAGYAPIVSALPLVGIAFAAFAWLARPLNLISVSAEAAATRGVNVLRAQRVAFFSASLATGAAVSVGGPIGFVGIIVPHLVRLLVGADNRLVLPASTFFGAAFLVACDVISRDRLCAGRAAGGHHHRGHWGAVFSVATDYKTLDSSKDQRTKGPRVDRTMVQGSKGPRVLKVLLAASVARVGGDAGRDACHRNS